MNMNPHLQRALLLHEQGRYQMAEEELRQSLAQEPHDAYAHALLALCLKEREKFKEATAEAQQAIHLAPDFAFCHYALAVIWLARNFEADALNSINEAIRLDATDPDYFALLAALQYQESRWMAALKAAEQGLQFDAEHIGCNNLRAMSLIKLGRREEAGATIDSTLSRNPDNAVTHANQGWAYLEQNNPEKALYHFKESLRLDPENEWAREGIVTALKAKHFIYSLMLRYFLWMAKLPPQVQMGIIVGGWFGNRLLSNLGKGVPALAPYILPIQLLYLAFAIMTWTANPLFNLLLRMNKFGCLVLSREEIVSTNWIGGCLLFGVLAIGASFVVDSELLLLLGIASGLLILPLSGASSCHQGWPRNMMFLYNAILALVGIAAAYLNTRPEGEVSEGLAGGLITGFMLGVFLSGWVVNGLMFVRVRR
jgi:tetratricopeptide (TPR) repeat protein